MKKILIITKSDDNECVGMVEESLKARGAESFRCNSDEFPTELRVSLMEDSTTRKLRMISSAGEVDLDEVTAVWYRRLHVAAKLPATMHPEFHSPSVLESQTVFYGLLGSLKTFIMDPYMTVRKAGNKQLQLMVARELGLEIPRTLITNNPDAVREFFPLCTNGMITKMMSSFIVNDGKKDSVVYTTLLKESDLQDMDGLLLCPMTFQENISKKVELRITIVGNRVFSAAIDSQASKDAKNDWRRDGLGLITQWENHPLPPEIETKLLVLMDRLHLNYGAIDMILTPDNRYVFLEINPGGEFFWLQINSPHFPISNAIADVLLGESFRRELYS